MPTEKKVWDTFGCTILCDYHDLYLRTDVLLLNDVFENFRKLCLELYRLDPAYYYTSPGLSWEALLEHTGGEFELLTDIDMYLFIEKGMRGGIQALRQSQTTTRCQTTIRRSPKAESSSTTPTTCTAGRCRSRCRQARSSGSPKRMRRRP